MIYRTENGRRVQIEIPVRRKPGGKILVREIATGTLFYTREVALTPAG